MKILISESELEQRVAELGREITAAYRGKPLTVVAIMNGAILFAADLVRRIELPLQLDSFAASSYRHDCSPAVSRSVRNSSCRCAAGLCCWWTIFWIPACPCGTLSTISGSSERRKSKPAS